jgi:hypothetical protein
VPGGMRADGDHFGPVYEDCWKGMDLDRTLREVYENFLGTGTDFETRLLGPRFHPEYGQLSLGGCRAGAVVFAELLDGEGGWSTALR